MFMREGTTLTLADVRESVEADPGVVASISNREVRLDLTGAGTIALGDTIEIPANEDGLKALGSYLDVPSAFLLRQDADLQQTIVTTMLERQPGVGAFVYSPTTGLQAVRDPAQRVIPVGSLLEIASRVIDPSAPVRDFWSNSEEFRLDVYAPEGFERGTSGDREVGDLSAAGVRFFQDRKKNLAPSVSRFQYRFWCTNGMTTRDDSLKIDARGASIEEVLAEFEAAADRAFRQVEGDIEAFYSLRSERVDNPERTLLRLGADAGLPVRTITRLQERVPLMIQENVERGGDENVTMFDLVNLITNQANDPGTRRRAGAATALESIGGLIVSEHADRCNACQSRLIAH